MLTLGSALERTPDHPLVYGALGRVWLDIAQARNDRVALNKALEALERAGSRSAATSEALTLYGRALLQSGRVDVAERILQQATERYPIEPAAFLFYATAAERRAPSGGRPAGADSVRRPRRGRSRLRGPRRADCGALASAR